MLEAKPGVSLNGKGPDPTATTGGVQTPHAESALSTPVPVPEDVIIFIPGIGASESVQPSHVADLLCWELNLQATNRAMTFTSKTTSVDGEVVYRIQRTGESEDVAGVVDVYTYDVVAELDQSPTSTNPLWRVISLGLTLLSTVLIVAGVWLNPKRRQKSFFQVAQLLVVLVMVLFIVIYFAVAVIALVQAVITLMQGNSSESVIRWPQWIVLTGAVIGGLVPGVRDRMNWLGQRSVQMAQFTHTADLRNRLSGGVLDLIDRIARRPEVKRVHIVGYSFGSLVALEAVYPQGGHTGAAVKLVDTLTTIGSPFGIVCMVRRNYREGRTLVDAIRPEWLNIYQPIDALGFNFRVNMKPDAKGYGLINARDQQSRVPDENCEWDPDLKLNLVNFLMLRSLSAHAGYWDSSKTARSALGLVVAKLISRHPELVGDKRRNPDASGPPKDRSE